MEPNEIIIRPVSSESALERVERENKLTFIVNIKSNKKDVKYAIEKLYGVKVKSINTMITPAAEKKASVVLNKEFSATELATRIGLL